MGVLGKLFGSARESKETRAKDEAVAVEAPPCPHVALIAHWDGIDDIGHEDRATSFVCEACGETFSPEEASLLRATQSERLAPIVEEETVEENRPRF